MINMANVKVEGWRNGDGYLQVDTSEFIAERGEFDQRLTDALTRYVAKNGEGHSPYASDDVCHEWAVKVNGGEPTSGLYGDGDYWSFATCNMENILTNDISVFLVNTETVGTLAIINGHGYFLTGSPEVYRCYDDGDAMTSWADFARAYGSCVNGHTWDTDDGFHMYADGSYSGTAPRIDAQTRIPFGDRSRAYVACPECGKAVHFTN